MEFTLLKGREEQLRRNLAEKLLSDYTVKTPRILRITVHEITHEISIKLCKNSTKEPVDIATVAYYIERDLKNNKFFVTLDSRSLEVDKDTIRVLFFDNEPPRINMKTISPGFAAIIIVIALAILTGIAVFLCFLRRSSPVDALNKGGFNLKSLRDRSLAITSWLSEKACATITPEL